MRRILSRWRDIAPVLALAAAGGCHGLREDAVPGCPYCGDPVTRHAGHGQREVVARWRVAQPFVPSDASGAPARQPVPPARARLSPPR
jgi:hypothetical protein